MEWVAAPKPHQRMFTVLRHPEAADGFWLAGGGGEDRRQRSSAGLGMSGARGGWRTAEG